MTTDNFSGNNGDGTFNLHGFDIRLDPKSDTLSLLLINHRPPINPVTGVSLDAVGLGANSTIELFQSHVGSDSMRHVRTYTDPAIQTPNQVAWVNDNAFVFTNDHSAKVGFVSLGKPLIVFQHEINEDHSVGIWIYSLGEAVLATAIHIRIYATSLTQMDSLVQMGWLQGAMDSYMSQILSYTKFMFSHLPKKTLS